MAFKVVRRGGFPILVLGEGAATPPDLLPDDQVAIEDAMPAQVAALDAAEAVARANREALEAIDAQQRATVRVQAAIQAFIGRSPAQLDAWIDAQLGDLSTPAQRVNLIAMMKSLGRMVLILARREFR